MRDRSREFVSMRSVSWGGFEDCSYDLVQSLCGTETGGAGTDDKDIDVAVMSC